MLKIITTVREETESIRVHLYGQFTEEYVPEVEKVLSGRDACPRKVVLELSHVTFVDREAMRFLCGTKSRNISVENVPSYVTRWIEQENRCGPAPTPALRKK
ncbi:MAG: hypothetical protein JOZ96_20935 [Acidobacteria bacterium]|nr:hypothetical protein [Acidobacteriota bacterium]